MSKKVCLAQSVEELKFILERVDKSVISIPLNLETQLYCVRNKINFYNPINFIKNNFYENVLIESENLINNLNFGKLKYDSHKKEYKALIRFRFFSAAYLIELVEKINESEEIDEIFISGWSNYFSQYSKKNYFVSYLVLNLVKNIKISKLTKQDKNKISTRDDKRYFILNKDLDKNKKYVLMNNIGYNFLKFVFTLRKKNFYILVPLFNKINFVKKILMKVFKIIFIEFDSQLTNEKKSFYLPPISFFYKKNDLSQILDFRKEQELGNLMNLEQKSEVINSLFNEFDIKLVITNTTRGIDGFYIEAARQKKISSICIPHGTLSAPFNKFDKIYKNIIAEAISIDQSEFIAAQSKISKSFFKSNNCRGKTIDTGNLIFSEAEKSKKNKILFAVTLKDFFGLQFLGVEMYYEFLDNLSLLNQIAKKNNLAFLIKPHPSIIESTADLKKEFRNLEFTNKKISYALKNVFATISFSSTVIEDSLYSNIPVILLDRWKRYKHCEAEENVKKKNSAIYYVNNENDLIDCIATIKKSDNILFENYIFAGSVKNNINNLFNKLL